MRFQIDAPVAVGAFSENEHRWQPEAITHLLESTSTAESLIQDRIRPLHS